MATIPQTERNTAIDTVFRVAGEDSGAAASLVFYLYVAFPTFDWMGIFRTRIPLWQPYKNTGLSTAAFADDVARLLALLQAP